ncbi:MAG: type II secretion system F family protein [Candidatus Faecisoma sp.]|nr:type II secretion system F family protein [Candidatus Faecisoma sp.]
MKVPKILKPIVFVLKLPITLIKYCNIGLFFTLYYFIDIILRIITWFFKYLFIGFVVICRYLYRFIRYVGMGIIAPLIVPINLIIKSSKDSKAKQNRKKRQQELLKKNEEAKARNKLIEEENKKRLKEIKKAEFEELVEQQKKKNISESYVNENIKLEKKTLGQKLNDSIEKFNKKVKEWWANTPFAKNSVKKNDINRQALLLDLTGDDAKKSSQKVMFKYVAKSPEGNIIKGYFPAYSKVEVHSFLLSEGNEVYSIETNKWIQQFHPADVNSKSNKIKTKDLIFFITQLSTYIKAGIPLVEALKILSRQYKNANYQRIFRSLIYELSMGASLSDAMDKQGVAFPKLLINMVKVSEMTGELPEALDDMAEYYTEIDRTRKQMITALTYPAIIFVVAIAAIVFIMVWVVPRFVTIYSSMEGSELPGITQFVLNASIFLQKKWLWLVLGISLFTLIFVYMYKNIKSFRTFIQYVMMHLPIIGQVVIYNEVTMFTKTFASLLAHNVFITDSMEILNKISNNEIYKSLILDTITNLAKGEKISLAFNNHWAFPVPAYEMIVTGEKTGQLPEMMDKVAKYYQELHANSVTRIKTFVEPIMILFLTVIVGGIILSIVIPMFNLYNLVQGY